jgi:hypothetical protein
MFISYVDILFSAIKCTGKRQKDNRKFFVVVRNGDIFLREKIQNIDGMILKLIQ